jgi:hypothetical protein
MSLRKVYEDMVKAAEEKPHQPRCWGVLYTPPNPDGSNKKCENCFMWCKTEQCLIFPATKKISKDMICGYHVFGTPLDQWFDRGIDYADEYCSGLETVRDGTSCDSCRHYEGSDLAGICTIVQQENGQQAEVKAKGCCAAWEKARGAK